MSNPEHVASIVGRIMREMVADLARLQGQPSREEDFSDIIPLPPHQPPVLRQLTLIQGGKS